MTPGIGLVARGVDDSGAAAILKSSPNLATQALAKHGQDLMTMYKSRLAAKEKARIAQKPLKLDLPDISGIVNKRIAKEVEDDIQTITNTAVAVHSQEMPLKQKTEMQGMIEMAKAKVEQKVATTKLIQDQYKEEQAKYLANEDQFDTQRFGDNVGKYSAVGSYDELVKTYEDMGSTFLSYAPTNWNEFTSETLKRLDPSTTETARELETGGVRTTTKTEVPEEDQIASLNNELNAFPGKLSQAREKYNALPQEKKDEYDGDLGKMLYHEHGQSMIGKKKGDNLKNMGEGTTFNFNNPAGVGDVRSGFEINHVENPKPGVFRRVEKTNEKGEVLKEGGGEYTSKHVFTITDHTSKRKDKEAYITIPTTNVFDQRKGEWMEKTGESVTGEVVEIRDIPTIVSIPKGSKYKTGDLLSDREVDELQAKYPNALIQSQYYTILRGKRGEAMEEKVPGVPVTTMQTFVVPYEDTRIKIKAGTGFDLDLGVYNVSGTDTKQRATNILNSILNQRGSTNKNTIKGP